MYVLFCGITSPSAATATISDAGVGSRSSAALAGCDASEDTNMTNIDVNAVDENLALPPVDMNADMNADMNMDVNAMDNAADNAATDNTTNSY